MEKREEILRKLTLNLVFGWVLIGWVLGRSLTTITHANDQRFRRFPSTFAFVILWGESQIPDYFLPVVVFVGMVTAESSCKSMKVFLKVMVTGEGFSVSPFPSNHCALS